MNPEFGTASIRNVWAEERSLRALQTIGRLIAAAELLINAGRTEGFDGHVQREADLQGTVQDLIELARQIAASGETK